MNVNVQSILPPRPVAVAIDGPVASGKTAVGKVVAKLLGIRFLDTGNMYRAVTLIAIERGINLNDQKSLVEVARTTNIQVTLPTVDPETSLDRYDRIRIAGKDVTNLLRSSEVEHGVSLVATISGVRSELVRQQRTIALKDSIVMVGRDIGTVVLPNAPIKIYLTATVEIRAKRRSLELQGKGQHMEYARILDEIMRRDKIDSGRRDSPLSQAPGSVLIDTENVEVHELAQRIAKLVSCQ